MKVVYACLQFNGCAETDAYGRLMFFFPQSRPGGEAGACENLIVFCDSIRILIFLWQS